MNRVTVKIANQEYRIVGEEKKEYLLQLASYVDEEMDSILKQNPKINHAGCAVLSAINIADRLFQERAEMEKPKKEYDVLLQKQQSLENELTERNMEIERLRKQLDENDEEMTGIALLKQEFEQTISEKQREVDEANRISNEFQNRMYRLQLELEELKEKMR